MFDNNSKQDWLARFNKEINGADINKLSKRCRAEEINIHPYFTAGEVILHDLSGLLHPKSEQGWEQTYEVLSPTTNTEILSALNFGADSLYINGISDQIIAQLANIEIENIVVHYVVKSEKELDSLIKNLSTFKKKGFKQTINTSDNTLLTKINKIFPDFATVEIDTTKYHNEGANLVLEMVAALVEANTFNTQNFRFRFAIGTDYLLEIARLRAFRILWANLAQIKKVQQQCLIQAETSKRELSPIDTNTNLLRNTTAAMAVICGTANSLVIQPHTLNHNTDSDRLALNIQNILKYESGFNQIFDPGYGSYYIEALTEELINITWNKFILIEEEGKESFEQKSLLLASEISRIKAIRDNDFESGKRIKVGWNKYK